MTCYDCIHCDACSDAGDSGYSSLKEDASKCKYFKNKADFVEVVRCKECANGCHKTDISVLCRIFNVLMITEDYCSYGCKKDEPTKIQHNSLCETETFEGR